MISKLSKLITCKDGKNCDECDDDYAFNEDYALID